MKIFFDTEFEGLYKNANLISIGFITEDNRQLYIENELIEYGFQSEWIKEHVLANTIKYGDIKIKEIVNNESEYFIGRDFQIRNKVTP